MHSEQNALRELTRPFLSPAPKKKERIGSGYARLLQVGVNRKLASSLSACRSAGLHFIPLVAETLGGLADDTIQTVRSIGKAIADRVGTTDSSNSSKHLFGRLAIALWRGNACLWLHRLPTLPPSLDGVP